jgi:taurine transport system permease protein
VTTMAHPAVATCVAAVLLWWLLARLEVVPPTFLPSPAAVVSKLVSVSTDGFQDATLLQHLLASVGRVSAALAGAIIFGVVLGFAMHLSETARGVISPLLEFYRRSRRSPICRSSSSGLASASSRRSS